MDNNIKRKKVLKVIGLLGLFLLVFGLSYALFTVTLNGTKKVKVKTGKLELQLLDENNNDITDPENEGYSLNFDNVAPMSDEDGLKQEGFVFKLKNSGTIVADYKIYLDDVELSSGENRIDDKDIRYSLVKNTYREEAKSLFDLGSNPNRVLDSAVIEPNRTYTYSLKIWIDENAGNDAMNKIFHATLRVEGVQYRPKFSSNTMADTLYRNNEKLNLSYAVPNMDSQGEDGLYRYIDTNGVDSYVYRGLTVDNNYVDFANQTWRILRIQSDGTVKLILDDVLDYESELATDSESGEKVIRYSNPFGTVYNKYSGSYAEQYINDWYQNTMMEYDSKIEENTYCSDRYEDKNSAYFSADYVSNEELYGIYNRLDIGTWDGLSYPSDSTLETMSWYPSISCEWGDKINAKAALITADEYILAGGGWTIKNYLDLDYSWWTMSPMGISSYEREYLLNINGGVYWSDKWLYTTAAVRPVITLKANTTIISGNGTSDSPYVVG